ncbi:hypothetical protein SFRURICE_020168 [Spodoptera frugiperda]|nr:hypothetical protein SFRURICE_020168 [Spodoptera frugiperda]
MQRHAFYPQMGRQRCILQLVMPLYIVHPLFCVCKSYVIGVRGISFLNPKKAQKYFARPTRESNPEPLVRQSHLRPLEQIGS